MELACLLTLGFTISAFLFSYKLSSAMSLVALSGFIETTIQSTPDKKPGKHEVPCVYASSRIAFFTNLGNSTS